MIRSVNEMKNFKLVATDGRIGTVDDFYFDVDRWAIRYVVVDAGPWLQRRTVLISPVSVKRIEWGERQLLLGITRDQIKHSPAIDRHQSVSRRLEMDYLDYYAYPYYWGHDGLWGAHELPMRPGTDQIARQRKRAANSKRRATDRDQTRLRSAADVMGNFIRAADGDLGQVAGCLFDDVSWAVQYLVVNTGDPWLGEHVLVAPNWITNITWSDRSVGAHISRQRI